MTVELARDDGVTTFRYQQAAGGVAGYSTGQVTMWSNYYPGRIINSSFIIPYS